MPRTLALTAATALTLLGLAASAHAASLVYVKDHDVWIANADGGGAVRVTADGTADAPYSSPTMRADGTIAAVKGITHVRLLRQNGEVIRTFVPRELHDTVGGQATMGLHGLDFSPDGTKLTFAKISMNCAMVDCLARGSSAVMDLEGRLVAEQGEYKGAYPSWVSDDLVLSHGGYLSQNMIWNWRTGAWANWFDDSDLVDDINSTDLGDGQLSANLQSYVAIRGYGDSTAIATYRVNGDVTQPNPPLPTFLCFATGPVSSPTASGDGSTAYWHEPDGVWSMAISPDCPNGQLLIPGASEPDWSPASVAPGPKHQPAKGKPAAKKACKKLKGKRKRACLKRARR